MFKRIEITTLADRHRVFLEPDGSTTHEPFPSPAAKWAINHPQQAEEYCQQRTTWWERIVAAMRSAW